MKVDNLTVTDIAYPLITRRVMGMFQQQLAHVHNGCISDDPERLTYVKVGTVNYQSLYWPSFGALPVTAWHKQGENCPLGARSRVSVASVLKYSLLGWWILGYNRRRVHALGKKVPPDSMSPNVYFLHL